MYASPSWGCGKWGKYFGLLQCSLSIEPRKSHINMASKTMLQMSREQSCVKYILSATRA